MKPKREDITGIILAGGQSKRMGTDKAFLILKGQTFMTHTIAALETVAHKVIIVANDEKYDVFGKERFGDIIPDAGPLSGLYTGLYHSNTTYNLVLGCDTPLVNEKILQLLLDHIEDAYDAVQFESDGHTMPLLAVYNKSCQDKCLELLESGERRLQRSVTSFFNTKTVPLAEHLKPYVLNINTPEDFNKTKE